MICPFCNKDGRHKTPYSEDADVLDFKRRGRKCVHCGKVFETIERATGELYHRRPVDADQLMLFAEGILESRDLNHAQQKRVKEIQRELRRIQQAG